MSQLSILYDVTLLYSRGKHLPLEINLRENNWLPSVGHDPTVLSFVSDEFTIQLIQIKVSDSQSSPSNALLNES
jgi:hypothetical protein